MPPKNQAETAQGCLVRGKTTGVTGAADVKRIGIAPEKAQMYNGVFYTATPQTVAVAPDGTWEMRLPPGSYTVQIGDDRFAITVPFGATRLEFAEAIQQ